MTTTDIVNRLLVLAAKKKHQRKYSEEAEHAFDALLFCFVEESDYSKKDRAFRLLLRLHKALEAEGYTFRDHVMTVAPSTSPKAVLKNKAKNLAYSGTSMLLLKSQPPTGIDIKVVVKLVDYLGSKQCYKFDLYPAASEMARKNGLNSALPKPLTWSKLENHGLIREPIMTSDGRVLIEEFMIDGVRAWSLDRITFYIANAGMCRRWVEGLDRIVSEVLDR